MFFRKKQKVDLDAKFKEVYHEVNKITADAGNELDVTIKYSQLKLACRKYDELIDLIHQGANFEEKHFLSLKESVEEETKSKAYKKDFDYTYTLGVFETIELLKNRPDLVLRVYIKSNSYKNKGIPIIDEICREKHIELIESDNTIQKLSKKDNCFAIAIIKKYEMTLQEGNHVVLVNPGDMGNMGTIMRTMLGFNYYNLAIIRPGVDVFDPRVLRASMGAMFHLNIEYFDSFEDYLKRFPSHDIYTLMLKGATNIHKVESKEGYHSLVFGNESSGLPDEYLDYGKSIFIPHSHHIDSLNLSMALGMTLMHFSKDEFKDKEVL